MSHRIPQKPVHGGSIITKRKRFLKLGTRSLLVGAHQFLLHPLFLTRAWTILYGFPFDPRLWASFFLHDLGYIGKDNLDGVEGEMHPELGGMIMEKLFGKDWGDFTRYHSRFFSNVDQQKPSALCAADKLATTLVPKRLYLTLIHLSGEVDEYLEQFQVSLASKGKYASEAKCGTSGVAYGSLEHWYASVVSGNLRWIAENTNPKRDFGRLTFRSQL